MFKNILRVTIRNIKRNKLLSFVNIAGLAIGLTCIVLITLFVKDEWSFDRFNKNGENIYRIVRSSTDTAGNETRVGNTGLPQGPVCKAEVPEIENYCRIKGWDMDVRKANETLSSLVLFADPSIFNVFTIDVLKGNVSKMLEGRNSVVLTNKSAQKYFGTENPIGKTVEIQVDEDFENFVITGVVKNPPSNASVRFDMLIPMERQNPTDAAAFNDEMNNWSNGYLNTFLLLRKDANAASVEKKIWNVYLAHNEEEWKAKQSKYGITSMKFGLQPLFDIHLNADYFASNGLSNWSDATYAYILSFLAVLILAIACINFINIALAKSMQRSKEIGIRKVSGSSRWQVMYQFLGESFIFTCIAFALSLVLVQLILPSFNQLSNKSFSLAYLIQPEAITIFIGLIIIVSLLAGFYPAFVASGFQPVKTLYGRFKLSGKNILGKSLIVVQFVIASGLIICTLVFNKQFDYISRADLGYNVDNMLYLQFPWNKTSEFARFKNELKAIPSIESVGTKSGNWNKTMFAIDGKQTSWVYYEHIDDNYLQTLQIPLQAGRYLSYANVADTVSNCMVNEAFVDQYLDKSKSPIGQVITDGWGTESYTIVGVVKNYHSANFKEEIQPIHFSLDKYGDLLNTYIKFAPGKEDEARAAAMKVYKSILPFAIPEFHSMKQWLMDRYAADAQWKQIVLFTTIIAIIISLLGLFAITVFAIEQRLKEIGIRKILGASVTNIVSILSKDYVVLVMIALLIASPLAWWMMNKWLEDFAYRTSISWTVFAITICIVVCISLLTISIQAIKAAVANPVKSLRTE
mgnify:CR=1 FL=1